MKITAGSCVKWTEAGLLKLSHRATRKRLRDKIAFVEKVHEWRDHGPTATLIYDDGETDATYLTDLALVEAAPIEFPDPPTAPAAGSAIDAWIKWAADRIAHRAAVACERIRQSAC